MAGIGLGLGIIISSATTKYRDFSVLLGFAVQLGMYITPIIYPLSFFQNSSYRWIILLNPLTPVVESFRWTLFGRGSVDIWQLTYSIVFMIIVLLFGMLIFNKVERNFMDTV
jgi:lipopolysaccharide transport system permease protein